MPDVSAILLTFSKTGGCIGGFPYYKYDIICPGRGGRQKMRDVLAVLAISAFYLMAWLQKMRDVLAVSPLLQKVPDVSAISLTFFRTPCFTAFWEPPKK